MMSVTMTPESESEKDNPSKLLSNLFRILMETLLQKAHKIVPVQQKKKIHNICSKTTPPNSEKTG